MIVSVRGNAAGFLFGWWCLEEGAEIRQLPSSCVVLSTGPAFLCCLMDCRASSGHKDRGK